MSKPKDHQKFSTETDFQNHAQSVVDAFITKIVIYPPLAVELAFYASKREYEKDPKRSAAGAVCRERTGDVFKLHICQERMSEMTAIALQGYLEHEMALCIQQLQPEFYTCNFKAKIFPLMPVAGSAEMFILELTIHLEEGLKSHLAARMLAEMGHGSAQAHYFYTRLLPDPSGPELYKRAANRLWIRAMHLCGKLKDFMPVFLLSKMKVEFSKDLETLWWKINDYLLAEDRAFLTMLADIPIDQKDARYPDKVVEMFKMVQIEYLEKQKSPSLPSSFH